MEKDASPCFFSVSTETNKKGSLRCYVRHGGKIAYVMLTERVFDKVWPDLRRAWTVEEMPDDEREMLMQALVGVIDEDL